MKINKKSPGIGDPDFSIPPLSQVGDTGLGFSGEPKYL